MRKNRYRREAGSSLIESSVALSLVVVGILGIVTLYTRSFALNRAVVNETVAAELAAEGIEVVKNIIDTNVAERGSAQWRANLTEGTFMLDFESSVASGRSLTPSSGAPLHYWTAAQYYGLALTNGSTATPFVRSVTVRFPSDTVTSVTSTVAWTERGESRSLTVQDFFYNWRR